MIFIIVTILLGIIWGVRRQMDYYLYLFFFSIIYLPLFLNWTHMYQYQGFVPIFLTGILFLSNINMLFKSNTFSILLIELIFVIISFVCLIYINSFVNNYDTFKGLLFFRNYFWPLFLFIIIISIGRIKINLPKILLFIFITQVVLVIIQYLGGSSVSNYFVLMEFEKDGKIQFATSISILEEAKENGGKLLVGSFGKITRFANFLSLFVTYWTGFALLKFKKLRLLDWAVIIISLGIILFTGVRSPLICAVVGCSLSFFVINNTGKKKLVLIISTSLLFFFITGIN